jgi:hypothetical protein
MTDDQLPNAQTSDGIELIEHQLTEQEVVPIVYWQLAHRWQNYTLPVAPGYFWSPQE